MRIKKLINGLNLRTFPVAIGNLFTKFPEKKTTLRGIPKCSKMSYRRFPFHLILLPGFLEFSLEWFAFRVFNDSPLLRKLSSEISVPLATVSKVPEFLVKLNVRPNSHKNYCAAVWMVWGGQYTLFQNESQFIILLFPC